MKNTQPDQLEHFLSKIGFGGWTIGGPWQFGWGPTDDSQSLKAIHFALDHGINWIDTAPAYGWGHSETIVGQAIEGRRDSVFIATKCGLLPGQGRKLQKNLHPKSMRQEIEASLKRLKTDYIDLYQLHYPDKAHPVEKTWEEMVRFKEQGRIRFLGVSNFDIPMMQRCLKIHPIDTLQSPFNLMRREIEAEIIPFCSAHGIRILAYSPLQSGLLSGSFNFNQLAADDWRRNSPDFREPALQQALEFVASLRPIARFYGKTVGQLALAWVLQHSGIAAAIVGARTANQVAENIAGAGWHISAGDLSKIDVLAHEASVKI